MNHGLQELRTNLFVFEPVEISLAVEKFEKPKLPGARKKAANLLDGFNRVMVKDGFGFTQTMDKLGVERRLITAGANKGFLDPFSPADPQQVQYARQMLAEIHAQFIQVVRQGRGKRLKETPDTFSGLVWSGEKSIALGLADGLGSVESVARDVIKAEDIVDFTPHQGLADRLAGKFGVVMANILKPAAQSGMKLR